MEGHRFNTGVHYIGELGEGDRFERLYRQLGVLEDVEFIEMHPDGYDHVVIGHQRFDIPKGKEAYMQRLTESFPKEHAGIKKLFAKIEQIDEVLRCMVLDQYGSLVHHVTTWPWLLRTGRDLIHAYVRDEMLRGIVLAQAGNHGMPPGQVSAAVQAGMMKHYFNGGYHPKGGGMAIARAFVRALKKHGGVIRLSTPVRNIRTTSRTITGVELTNGEYITARQVISNADPHTTFCSLMMEDQIPWRLRRKLAGTSYSTSCLSLYLVLDTDLRVWGLDSGNYWIYDSPDMDLHYSKAITDHNVYHPPSVLFVTATMLKDPSKRDKQRHQLEVFTLVGYDAFAKWAHTPQGDRGEAYLQLKEAITERMLQSVDRRFPGLAARVVWKDLGTPLSNCHYIRAHRGNMYGTAKSVMQSGPLGFATRTPFKNLYLCGASTMGHGVAHASATGLTAAAKVLKCPVASLWPDR